MSTKARASTCTVGSAADVAAASRPRTIILGLGNPLLTDDGVGLRVVAHLRRVLVDRPSLELAEDYAGGLRLMERLVGYERAVIVDAERSGGPPGQVSIRAIEALPTRHVNGAHDVDLRTALEFGRRAGFRLPAPGDIRIVAVETVETDTLGEQCTPAVTAGIPHAAEVVQTLLNAWR